jgi:hypothetical protein
VSARKITYKKKTIFSNIELIYLKMRLHSLLKKRNKQYVYIKNHYCCVDLLGGTLEYQYEGLDEKQHNGDFRGI